MSIATRELFFVRHGQTEWNAIRRMQGQWNSDLNKLGREQAEVSGRFLKNQCIEHLVASPLDRTRQTAEIINRYLDLNVVYDERIKEWDCGDWSGEMWEDVQKKWPEEWAAWEADRFNYRGPNCENYQDMIDRSTPFLREISDSPHARIAIVSHGMIGRVMVGTLLGMSPNEMMAFHQPNDAIFHVTVTGESHVIQHYIGGDGPIGGLPPRHW